MRIRSTHHARRYHARDRASRPMFTLCWLPFARKIRHKELFVDLFTPTERYIYPFSVFQTTSTLLVAHILNLAWLRCGLDRQKSCPLLEKKWLFSVLFSLKITADLQNKLSGRVHVMTDNLLWIQRMSGTEAVFRFATQRSVKYLFTCESFFLSQGQPILVN